MTKTKNMNTEVKIKILFEALCNSGEMGYSGIMFDYTSSEYKEAKNKLDNPAFEDVLIQMIKDGKVIILWNVENEEVFSTLSLQKLLKYFEELFFVDKYFTRVATNIFLEDYDSEDCWSFIQYIAEGKVIFG